MEKATRRDFLRLGACAATVAPIVGLGESGVKPSKSGLPAWAEREIETAARRYEAWKGTDETMAFVYTTDVHSYVIGISDPPNYKDPKMHVPLAIRCADRIGADFSADLGDLEIDIEARTPESLKRRIDNIVTLYGPGTKRRPCLFCVGNHDHGWRYRAKGAEMPVSNRRFGEAFNGLSVRAGHRLTLSDDMSWGCYDVPGKKMRVFFLNTSDGEMYYGISPEQLKFVAEGLGSLEPGWQALMLMHFCIHVPMGAAHVAMYTGCRNSKVLIRMVEDFVWRAKGSGEGVSWDFTRADGLFAGFFCGDSHYSGECEQNFIPYTLSQGYGYSGRQAYGGRFVKFDSSENCLFEIAAFKPAKAEAHVFRVGAGGAEQDRAYLYDRTGIEKCGGRRWYANS